MNMTKSTAPNLEAGQQESYYRYCLEAPVPVLPEKLETALGGPMPLDGALPFSRRAWLSEPGGDPGVGGWCVLPDGTGYVSSVTVIPGGSPEMVDWWFAWRGLDPLRYVIANPSVNRHALTMQSGKATDRDLTLRERYWDTTQEVVRMGETGPETEFLNFKCPTDVGFASLPPEGTLVCARGYGKGHPPFAGPDYFLCHLVVPTSGGVEVRTKYWIGCTVRYGKDERSLPDGFRIPPMFPKGILLRDLQEWTRLAAVLPRLYAEERDNM